MAKWEELQQDFSGGEVGYRFLMRDDTEAHSKSVSQMLNFMPTLQGTALRAPGTRYITDFFLNGDPDDGRVFPYLAGDGTKILIIMTPERLGVLGSLIFVEQPESATDPATFSQVDVRDITISTFKRLVPNGKLSDGFTPWIMFPEGTAPADDFNGVAPFGWVYDDGKFEGLGLATEDFSSSWTTLSMTNSFVVDSDSSTLILAPHISYQANFSDSQLFDEGSGDGLSQLEIRLGSTAGASDISLQQFSLNVGQRITPTSPELQQITGTFTAGQVIFIQFLFTANFGDTPGDDQSVPWLWVRDMDVLGLSTTTAVLTDLTEIIPYGVDEIAAVHYVQSPYPESAGNGAGKEIVFTHPNHPPKRFYFNPNGAAYVFEDVFSVANNDAQQWEQWNWGLGDAEVGYPATCTSYLGRLVLAGSTSIPLLGTPGGGATETVWATEVGKWTVFTPDPITLFSPDRTIAATDSVTFTTIYRSPIKWAIGQKQLLVGAEAMEYTASADGIFQVGDLGVNMQTTHGSNAVQPVGMGQFVVFPADAGKRVRALQYVAEDEGWIAPDLTLLHPELFNSTIVRMVRLRNPHQIVACVRGDGTLALLHIDSYAGVTGWSVLNVGGNIKDITVMTDANGEDILYLLVRRQNNDGTFTLNLEAIANWSYGNAWVYTNAHVLGVNVPPATVITGLEHLEGKFVDVIGDSAYRGNYQVSGGQITVDQIVDKYSVGLGASCSLTTLPLITKDPSSKKRYPKINIRTVASSRPFINGERPIDAADPFDPEQPIDLIKDNIVSNMGFNVSEQINISETLPFRVEILGIWGTVRAESTT
jgi:hypothetical protein